MSEQNSGKGVDGLNNTLDTQNSLTMTETTKELPMQKRYIKAQVRVLPSEEGAQKVYELAASSEFPVERSDWYGDSYIEVLDHSSSSIDTSRMNGSLALLAEHDPNDQIGVIDSYSIDADRVLRVLVRFSRSARGQEFEQDVIDGIRQNVSIGYVPNRFVVEKSINGGPDTWRAINWTPLEVSIVSIPADPTVGVGRSLDKEAITYPVSIRSTTTQTISEPEKTVMTIENTVATTAATVAAPVIDSGAVFAQIATLCENHGASHRTAEFISKNYTVERAAVELLSDRRSASPVLTAAPAEAAARPATRNLADYSLARAIKVALGMESGGLEAEMHAELKRTTPDSGRKSFLVPIGAIRAAKAVRALTTTVANAGGSTVYTEEGSFIELLRNKLVVGKAGATVMTGLVGNILMPKQTGSATATWLPENPVGPVAKSQLSTGSVLLKPKTLMAASQFSRQLLNQSALNIEALVQEDLAIKMATSIDIAALHGAGGDAPIGVYNQAGVNIVDFAGGSISYGKIIDMQTALSNANTLRGNLSFVTNPAVAGAAAKTLVANAAGSKFVWEGNLLDGQIAGFAAQSSNQILSNLGAGGNEAGLVFGNWSDLLIGYWGVMEIIVDEITDAGSAFINVTAYQQCDVQVRHAESFAKATGLVPA